jgi:oxygen-independent coproporphyrinogen-3 oxidase
MRSDLLKYLDKRIPRYTSYPTAVQFDSKVAAATYERWLSALPVDAPVSIYIHVPFCAELCLYCGCTTTVVRRYGPVAAYVELLEREFALVGRILGRRTASHIHWGGGTPTMMAAQDFMRVTAALQRNFAFASDAEVAIELEQALAFRTSTSACKERSGAFRASNRPRALPTGCAAPVSAASISI